MECTDTSPDGDQGRWRLAAPARLFVRDRRGAITLTFALLLLPLLAAIGLAIDFGNVMTMRTKAQMAADAAALQAVGTARELISAGGRTEPEIILAVAKAKQRGLDLFNAHAQQMGLKDYTVDVTITRDGVKLAGSANFTIQNPNFISKVVGYRSFGSNGAAGAAASLPPFTDVYLALDISQSMGIAATQAGMTTLYNATTTMKNANDKVVKDADTKQPIFHPIKCVFGCHHIEGVHPKDFPNKSYTYAETFAEVAKRVGVPLRIDVLRDATKAMIARAQKEAGPMPINQFALYTMGTSSATQAQLNEVAALTSNYNSLKSAADAIDIMAYKGGPESYISENLVTFAAKISAPGDGSQQSSAKKYAFIVTDGMRNIEPKTSPTCQVNINPPVIDGMDIPSNTRCISTVSDKNANGLNPSCEKLKNAGVIVGVVYTTYLPIRPYNPDGPDFYMIEPISALENMMPKKTIADVGNDLKKCASPGWFYEASDANAIKDAMDAMFSQTTTVPTLVN